MSKLLILVGEALVTELLATTFPVKLLVAKGDPLPFDAQFHRHFYMLDPVVAVLLAKAGFYVGRARRGRVYQMQFRDPRPPNNPDPLYWKDRACIRFYEDPTTGSGNPRDKRVKQADLWDTMLHRNPQPAAWRRNSV